MSRSHLIPTPITDKNGVTTIRHMKPDASASSKPSSIPPVSLAANVQEPAYKEGSVEHLTELIYGEYSPDALKLVEFMYDDDRETIPLAIRFLTTGGETAKSRARAVLDTALNEIGNAFNNREDDEDDFWRDDCHNAWSPLIKHRIASAWNGGNVLDDFTEQGGDYWNPYKLDNRISELDSHLNPLAMYGDRSGDDNYWRGLTATALTKVPVLMTKTQETDNIKLKKFVLWAGGHKDLNRVIRTATERQNLDATDLHAIMEEQDKLVPSLREGAL